MRCGPRSPCVCWRRSPRPRPGCFRRKPPSKRTAPKRSPTSKPDLLEPDLEIADTIPVEQAIPDEKIVARISGLLTAYDYVHNPGVTSENGFVKLTGTTDSTDHKERAREWAKRVEGVLGVQTDIVVDRSFNAQRASAQVRGSVRTLCGRLPRTIPAVIGRPGDRGADRDRGQDRPVRVQPHPRLRPAAGQFAGPERTIYHRRRVGAGRPDRRDGRLSRRHPRQPDRHPGAGRRGDRLRL